MRIVLFTNLLPVYNALEQLHAAGWLKAVVCTDRGHAQSPAIKELCDKAGIKFFAADKDSMSTNVKDMLTDIQPDVAISFGFGYHIPAQVFQLPPLGFYNVHFSLLPAYRGPDPIFHQLKNGEQMSGVSIHKLNERFDAGDIVLQQPVPIIPGETCGLCFSRHIPVAVAAITDLLRRLSGGFFLPSTAQLAQSGSYNKKITPADITINWNIQTAAQIDNLVNACNPAAGGAITFYKQQPVRIIEVSQVDGQAQQPEQPGTIIHAGPDGLFVYCLNGQLLRVNIISLNEGVITGAKLAALGVRAGDCFEQAPVTAPPIYSN